MRRSLTVGGLLLAAALIVLPAMPAAAVEPPPPPVTPIPSLPSQTTKTAAAGSWNEGKVIEMWRAILRESVKPGTALVHVPKPITPAAPVVRAAGSVAGGSAVVGFQAGWALGQGGLAAYMGATGNSYEGLICNAPDWYQFANSALMLGVTPDCRGAVTSYTPGSWGGGATYGSAQWIVRKTLSGATTAYSGGPGVTVYCTVRTAGGQDVLFDRIGGGQSMGSYTGTEDSCGSVPNGSFLAARIPDGSPGEFVIRSGSTGAILAQGTPNFVAGETSNRSLGCSIDWADGTTTTGTGSTYTETDGVPFTAEGTGCKNAESAKSLWSGGGQRPQPLRIRVGSTDEGGSITEISDVEVPPMSEPERQSLDPGLDNSKGLTLSKVVDGVQLSCMTWEADCVDWWAQSSSGSATEEATPYRCQFGGRPVPLTQCSPYRATFDTKTSTPTITDPTTGTESPWTSQPSTGNSTSPSTGPTPGADCFDGWSAVANPIEWVLHPVKCALVWAFVPRAPVVQEAVTAAGDAWAGKPPAAIATFLAGLNLAPQPEGCSVAVTLFGITFNVIDNCPGSYMGPIMAISKIVTSLAMIILVIVVVRRQIAGMVGYDNDH